MDVVSGTVAVEVAIGVVDVATVVATVVVEVDIGVVDVSGAVVPVCSDNNCIQI